MPLTRYYILEGDTTTQGGIVQTTTNPIVFNVGGKKQSCIGDNVWCPACQSMGQIIPSGPRLSFSLSSAMPALNDDLCLCKCSPPPKLINSQTSFKEIIDDNRLAQYQQARKQYQQSKLQNNLTNAQANDDDLPKFTVHFRRDDNYQGEYGFDWLRDEYIYPITEVNGQKEKLSLSNNKILIDEYRSFKKQPIKELDNIDNPSYTPAWLTLFAPTSPIGVSQVLLNLRIDLDESNTQPLTDNGTTLSFECSQGLQTNITTLSLGNALSQMTQEQLQFTQQAPIDYTKPITKDSIKQESKTLVYYQSQNPIIIITCTQSFKEMGYVKVFAQKGSTKKQVGLLCVYPNSEIKKAVIQPVFIKKNQSPVYDNDIIYPKNFKKLIQDGLLSQALIKAEFKPAVNLTILDKDFLAKYPDKNSPAGRVEEFLNDLVKIYHQKTKSPYNDKITYLFFTDYSAEKPNGSQTKGIALGDTATDIDKLKCRTENICNHWKNATVIFSNMQKDDNTFTVIHELGHTFGLAHIFQQKNQSNFENVSDFPEGYTDNIMDYHQKLNGDDNPYVGKMFSLFKSQWDKMYNDTNLLKGD